MAEFVPGYEFSFWTGIGAPRNTPAAIVDKLTAIPACPVRPKGGHSANARAYEYMP